jgi:predicted GNAT family N-acyltransferase
MLNSKHGLSFGSALTTWRLARLFSIAAVNTVKIETSQHTARIFQKFGFKTDNVVTDGFGPGIDRVDMSLSRAFWMSVAAED